MYYNPDHDQDNTSDLLYIYRIVNAYSHANYIGSNCESKGEVLNSCTKCIDIVQNKTLFFSFLFFWVATHVSQYSFGCELQVTDLLLL